MYKKALKIGVAGLIVVGGLECPWNFSEVNSYFHTANYVQAAEAIKFTNGDFEAPTVTDNTNNYQLFTEKEMGWGTDDTIKAHVVYKNNGNYMAASGNQWYSIGPRALKQSIHVAGFDKVRWGLYYNSGEFAVSGGTNVYLSPTGTADANRNLILNAHDSVGRWQEYKGTYIVPNGVSDVELQLQSPNGVIEAEWIDNLTFSVPSKLTLSGSFTKERIQKNQTSSYQLLLANIGGMPSSRNQVTIQLPAEVSYIAGTLKANGSTISGEQYNSATHKVTFTLDEITDSLQAVVTLDVKGDQLTTGSDATASATYKDKDYEEEQAYQATSDASTIVIEAGENPIITGDDLILKVGDSFNPVSGLSASDKEDGDLTGQIQTIDNPVDTSKVGEYTVKYQITDSSGNVATFKRKVTVRSNEKPSIIGDSEMIVKAGRDFDKMSSIQATDKEDGDLTANLTVSGDVNLQKIGDYTLTYTVTDSDGNQATFTRIVHVVSNDAPAITGEKETSLKAGTQFDLMSSMQATDKEDGDLTKQLTVEGQVDFSIVGDYTLTYHIADSDGNKTSFTRIIHVLSNEAPIILGEAEVRLNPNSFFDPLEKMSATDKEDGDLTKAIKVVTNDVNTKEAGTYHVKYQVVDSDGNEATFEKNIIVTNRPTIEATDQTIQQGSEFDPLQGVTATDKEDGDLTKKVKVKKSNVNQKVAGIYDVTYEVMDSEGNQTEKTIQVTVEEMPSKVEPVKTAPVQATEVISGPGPVQKQPQEVTLPKTGDAPKWPWSAASGMLLVSSGIFLLRKKK